MNEWLKSQEGSSSGATEGRAAGPAPAAASPPEQLLPAAPALPCGGAGPGRASC